jgi:hypothetical protein
MVYFDQMNFTENKAFQKSFMDFKKTTRCRQENEMTNIVMNVFPVSKIAFVETRRQNYEI